MHLADALVVFLLCHYSVRACLLSVPTKAHIHYTIFVYPFQTFDALYWVAFGTLTTNCTHPFYYSHYKWSAVAERPRDALCPSAFSFNSTIPWTQSFIKAPLSIAKAPLRINVVHLFFCPSSVAKMRTQKRIFWKTKQFRPMVSIDDL